MGDLRRSATVTFFDEDDFEPGQPLFRDRIEAGRVLAGRLAQYRGQRPVVLGIPRGGVVVAAEIARRLEGSLDIVVARKLGAPGSPELALGAVTADGGRFLNDDIIRMLGVSQEYLESVTAIQMAEAKRREEWLRNLRPPVPLSGRVAILVDDGLATGATMRAAVRSVRRHRPAKLIVAAPVGSRDACATLREEADEVVCPYQPEPFGAVGFFYEHFDPVEDKEVQALLDEAHAASSSES
jgi:predicted phosphoribosyltransferase